jgi:hypothetical protein
VLHEVARRKGPGRMSLGLAVEGLADPLAAWGGVTGRMSTTVVTLTTSHANGPSPWVQHESGPLMSVSTGPGRRRPSEPKGIVTLHAGRASSLGLRVGLRTSEPGR